MSLALVQDLTFETDELDLLARILPAAIEVTGVRHLFVPDPGAEARWGYPSHAAAYLQSFLHHPPEDIARWRPPDQRGPMHYDAICRLSVGDDASGLEQLVTSSDLAARTIELARAADVTRFELRTGEGPFAGADGTVGVGYRLTGNQGALLVSLCHIYYSK